MMRYRDDRGFTLVELLVVVAILAILAVLAAPRIQTAGAAARQARADKELKTIQDALENHYVDLGYYPNKLNDLVQRGYIKPASASTPLKQFQSPTSGFWYFYAVDNNNPYQFAHAYILGNPSKNAPTPNSDPGNDLHPTGLIPRGWPPDSKGWGWRFSESRNLSLFDQHGNLINGADSIPENVPTDLSRYRTNCQPGATSPCDLWSN